MYLRAFFIDFYRKRTSLQSDQDIIHGLLSDKRDYAANIFVRKYQRFVFSVAQRYLKSYEDACDASQEVFIKAIRNIGNFRGECSLQTWLYSIVINVCHSMNKKKKLRSFVSFSPFDSMPESITYDYNPENSTLDMEFQQIFDNLMKQLPEKQRETFILRYIDELSYEEISQMLGTSIGGLKANYFQAVKKLALLLKPDGDI